MMVLQNFALGRDSISLEWEGQYLDLHNCYDFKSLRYNLPARQVLLTWQKSSQSWASQATLAGLCLVFEEVSFFRVKERDNAYPFMEDDCLLSLSFHPVEARDDFASIWVKHSPADDLTFFFQSEWGIKIQAATVRLGPLAT